MAYIHADQINRPQRVTNPDQTLAWDGILGPFGETGSVSGALTMNLGFPGQYLDRETGIYQNRHRDYDPATGRYLQSDPIGLAGGINTYAYVGGNPLRFTDPTGESATIPLPVPKPIGNPIAPIIDFCTVAPEVCAALAAAGGVGAVVGTVAYPHIEPVLSPVIDLICNANSKEECHRACYATYEAQVEVCKMFPSKKARQQCYANAIDLLGECQRNCK